MTNSRGNILRVFQLEVLVIGVLLGELLAGFSVELGKVNHLD